VAKQAGWWSLDCDVEPNNIDLRHIAKLIIDGCTSGEICQDTSVEDDDEVE